MGRKVSDEYTVPLCRAHHDDLHRRGNEKSWWGNLQIEPLAIARQLWGMSPIHDTPRPADPGYVSPCGAVSDADEKDGLANLTVNDAAAKVADPRKTANKMAT